MGYPEPSGRTVNYWMLLVVSQPVPNLTALDLGSIADLEQARAATASGFDPFSTANPVEQPPVVRVTGLSLKAPQPAAGGPTDVATEQPATPPRNQERSTPPSATIFDRPAPPFSTAVNNGRGLPRFRLEGEDLVYEAGSKELFSPGSVNFSVELSGDGTLVAVPGFVFKRDNLDEPYMAISETGTVVIDPVNGNIYSSNNIALSVFNNRGPTISTDKSLNRKMDLLVVHPRGGRLVGWSMVFTFVYLDLRKESP